MQKAFENIVERLEELKKDVVDGKCPFKRNSRNCELQYSCETCYLTKAIKIVNRAARGYSHRNSDLVIDSSHRNEEVCEWKKYGMDIVFPYKTTCGTSDMYYDNYKFCPYCGKKIKVIGG